jgi:hypothetical protein
VTSNKEVTVEHSEVIHCRPTLAHATIGITEELSRNYCHVRSIYCSGRHHVVTIATNNEIALLDVRSYKHLQTVNGTCEERTVNLTCRSSMPTLANREDREQVGSSQHIVRLEFLGCIINLLLSNFEDFSEALVMFCLRLLLLQIIH